jgi:MYXO-CTERM domain-containing protein
MKRAALLVLSIAALAAASDARAWSPIDPSRPVWSGVVPYRMNMAGSADLGFATSESVVQMGMDDWTRVSCPGGGTTSLRAMYGGTTSLMPGTYEGTSVIGWRESSWRHDPNAIGVTGPRWGGSIIEADMELNGVNYTWSTSSGSGTRVNAYSIILHEGGHYYGLGHSSDSSATMYFAYAGGISMLNADDRAGICSLYPPTGGVDCTTTGCPSGEICMGGTCVPMTGDGMMCSPCTRGSDCSGGVCLRYPDGRGYCGRSCSSSSECGPGGMCVPTTVGEQCVRFSGTMPSCAAVPAGCRSDADCSATQRCNVATGACEARPTTGAELGQPCSIGGDCRSGLCFAGTCSQSCDWLAPTSCPAGFYCSGEATGSCGPGTAVCVAGSPGGGGEGAACASATDCASAYCASGVCTTPCIAGGAAGCPEGFSCQVGAVPGCGSCQRSGRLGDPCMVVEDCTTRLCLAGGDTSYCTQTCDAATPCPPRFACTDAGGFSVCVPDARGLGAPCADNVECLSGICASEGSTSYCTRVCDRRTDPCPESFVCVATTDPSVRICRPESAGGCGCRAPGAGPGSSGGVLALALTAVAIVLRRRRQR